VRSLWRRRRRRRPTGAPRRVVCRAVRRGKSSRRRSRRPRTPFLLHQCVTSLSPHLPWETRAKMRCTYILLLLQYVCMIYTRTDVLFFKCLFRDPSPPTIIIIRRNVNQYINIIIIIIILVGIRVYTVHG